MVVCEGSMLRVCYGCNNAFFIPQHEFGKCVDTSHMVLFESSLVFVVWRWNTVSIVEDDDAEIQT